MISLFAAASLHIHPLQLNDADNTLAAGLNLGTTGANIQGYLPANKLAPSVTAALANANTALQLNQINITQTLNYAASITPAAGIFQCNVNVGMLTGSLAMAAPTGTPNDGQVLTFRFSQDATGGRVITWDPIYVFPQSNPASTLPTTANAQYEITFGFHAPSGKWRARGAAGPF